MYYTAVQDYNYTAAEGHWRPNYAVRNEFVYIFNAYLMVFDQVPVGLAHSKAQNAHAILNFGGSKCVVMRFRYPDLRYLTYETTWANVFAFEMKCKKPRLKA